MTEWRRTLYAGAFAKASSSSSLFVALKSCIQSQTQLYLTSETYSKSSFQSVFDRVAISPFLGPGSHPIDLLSRNHYQIPFWTKEITSSITKSINQDPGYYSMINYCIVSPSSRLSHYASGYGKKDEGQPQQHEILYGRMHKLMIFPHPPPYRMGSTPAFSKTGTQ